MSVHRNRRLEGGQTLIVALIVLGVLLVLGFVFLGIINQNIFRTGRSQQRSVATDLADAGIRYAHSQMLNSLEGADWRPMPVDMTPVGTGVQANFTRDPDALYLRPGTGFGFRSDTDPQLDKGGPDGLGRFSRSNFRNGRNLIRVRWAPSDANIFQAGTGGALREPGRARNYIIIESIGRPGAINFQDPTSLPSAGAVQFQGYNNSNDFREALRLMQERDNNIAQSRKLIAFVSMGMLENARFIHNKDRASRPVEIGIPRELGAFFAAATGQPGGPVQIPLQIGGPIPGPGGQTITGSGGVYINGNLVIHGNVRTFLNTGLGDNIQVSGMISGADANASLTVTVPRGDDSNTGDDQVTTLTNANGLNSRSANFSTVGGAIRDGQTSTDAEGHPRYAMEKASPSFTVTDPDTGLNRYLVMTRDSGQLLARGNSGRFGHG
ncbi:MAG TPA: hypothetical protein VEX38_04780, partial [Fimbriimonadaceae bacterium]|nr:hypothetical protein [Fimbriimonadaceae bacterium]